MKILRFVLVIIGVLGVLAFIDRDAVERKTRLRVERMMEEMIAGGTSTDAHIFEAICQWHHGTKQPPQTDTIGKASLDFQLWRREKGLYRQIKEYEIESIEPEEGSSPRAVHVIVRIDGQTYGMRVVNREPITWLF